MVFKKIDDKFPIELTIDPDDLPMIQELLSAMKEEFKESNTPWKDKYERSQHLRNTIEANIKLWYVIFGIQYKKEEF